MTKNYEYLYVLSIYFNYYFIPNLLFSWNPSHTDFQNPPLHLYLIT